MRAGGLTSQILRWAGFALISPEVKKGERNQTTNVDDRNTKAPRKGTPPGTGCRVGRGGPLDIRAGVMGVVPGIRAALKGGRTWGWHRWLHQHVACSPGTPCPGVTYWGQTLVLRGWQVPMCEGGSRQGCRRSVCATGSSHGQHLCPGPTKGLVFGCGRGKWPHGSGGPGRRVCVEWTAIERSPSPGPREATAPAGGSGFEGRASLLGSGRHALACRPKSRSANPFCISNMVLQKSRTTICDR